MGPRPSRPRRIHVGRRPGGWSSDRSALSSPSRRSVISAARPSVSGWRSRHSPCRSGRSNARSVWTWSTGGLARSCSPPPVSASSSRRASSSSSRIARGSEHGASIRANGRSSSSVQAPSASVRWPRSILREARSRLPDVELQVHVGTIPQNILALNRRALDVVYAYLPFDSPEEPHYLRLGLTEHVLAIPEGHRFASMEQVPREELLNEPFIMAPKVLESTRDRPRPPTLVRNVGSAESRGDIDRDRPVPARG